ncbi:MAG: hypothetical protein SFY80_12665 [Verrucomicrobiota bacterium]|nr:hypothetical protein [Verrucomicrobiota bacterium]
MNWQALFKFWKPTPDSFAAAMLRELRESMPDKTFTYDKNDFSIKSSDGHVKYLGNMFVDYCRCPRAQRVDVLKRFCRVGEIAIPSHRLNAEDHLFIRLRERVLYEFMSLRGDGKGLSASYRLLTDDLYIELVYDTPDAIMSMSETQLTDLGYTLDQAIEQGRSNLRAMTKTPFKKVQPGVYEGCWGDNYDASRILLPERIAELKLQGLPVCVPVNRDSILVTGSDDESGLRYLIAWANRVMQLPRLMTLTALVFKDGKWQPFLPSEDSPLYNDFRKLQIMSKSRDYGEQVELLEQKYKREKADVFVAKYTCFENKQGRLRTISTWTKGVDTLLPVTDMITFVDVDLPKPTAITAFVSWEQATTVVGHLMEKMEYYPTRYRVRQYPNAEEMIALKNLSTQ